MIEPFAALFGYYIIVLYKKVQYFVSSVFNDNIVLKSTKRCLGQFSAWLNAVPDGA